MSDMDEAQKRAGEPAATSSRTLAGRVLALPIIGRILTLNRRLDDSTPPTRVDD